MIEWSLLHYGYVIVFLGTILEGDATLLAAAYLAHRGYLRLPLVILVATLATTGTNQILYLLGRRHGKERLKNLAETEPWLAKVAGWVRRRGPLLLFVSRYLWGLKIAIPTACGATGMRPWVFFGVNLAGAAVWGLPVGLAGYAGARSLAMIFRDVRKYESPIVGGLLLIVVAIPLWRTRGEVLKETWIAVREPEALAVRSVEVLARHAPPTEPPQ